MGNNAENNTNSQASSENSNEGSNVNVNSNSNTGGNTGGNATEIDYSKIESIVNKNVERKESAVLKSYFEQQGMSEEEAKQAMADYKANKQAKANEQVNELEAFKTENEQLKARLRTSTINSMATTVALDMGVDKNTVPYLVKMADMSKVIDEKGEVSEANLKTAIEQVLNDIPALKASQNSNKGFLQVGADGNNGTQPDASDEVRKLFGLKPKAKA